MIVIYNINICAFSQLDNVAAKVWQKAIDNVTTTVEKQQCFVFDWQNNSAWCRNDWKQTKI